VHGELFAGLASVEGGVWDVSCPRATTTPLFLIAQDATYVPADELASIAEDYQCTKAPEKLQYHYGNTRITKTHYDNCGESHEILFYNLATTTHSWPRFPTVAEGEPVSATNIALDFLLK
jgi:hypothetical protein